MGWEIELNKQEQIPAKMLEIFGGDLKDRPNPDPRNSIPTDSAGPLAYLKPEDDPVRAGKHLRVGPKSLRILKLIRDKWGDGAIVSFSDIADFLENRESMHRLVCAFTLNRLWRNGYLKKLVAGTWGQAHRGRYKNAGFGRYHGVHYEIIPRD